MTAAECITCPSCGHRIEDKPGKVLTFGPLTLDTKRNTLTSGDITRKLERAHARVLAALIRSPDHTGSRGHLLTVNDHWESPHILTVEIYHLRKHLVGTGVHVASIFGYGYELLHGEENKGIARRLDDDKKIHREKRQAQILCLIERGFSYRRIAEIAFCSKRTISLIRNGLW